jgi:nitrite reductase (cytochrome c-552)
MPNLKFHSLLALSASVCVLYAASAAAQRSDDDPTIKAWGKGFAGHVDMYMETKDMSNPTAFGGNVPYSKLIRFPAKTVLWAGYAFALDFNEERGHYYSQIDQVETRRNDKAFLNANGLVKFKGQPSACMNCHSGWAPSLINEMGWEEFNGTPYWDNVATLRQRHGEGIYGAELGSACADCHAPNMKLRVTRQAYINAMVARGYEADPVTGLKGTASEMRSHVCQQCHVEYYFKPGTNVLTFPWSMWPKGEPLKIEMIEAYYEAERKKPGGFQADWTHAVTKAPMLKMQHPEAEVISSGKHADVIGCVDCHMPDIQRNGRTVTDHAINSALNKLDNCQKCHGDMTTDQIRDRVYQLQVRNTAELKRAEQAILSLIQDVTVVREQLAAKAPFSAIADDAEREAAISKELAAVLDLHRRSSMRWDFIGASNSTGAHSPTEALRVLGQAVDLARQGQTELKSVADQHGIELLVTLTPKQPAPPAPLEPGNIVGSEPPEVTREADADVKALLQELEGGIAETAQVR